MERFDNYNSENVNENASRRDLINQKCLVL